MARTSYVPSMSQAVRIALVVVVLNVLFAKIPALRIWEKF